MLEQLIYKNHMNEVFEFGKDGIFVDHNDLHDYEWKVTSKGNRISGISKAVQKRKLPVTIICPTEEQGIAAKNRLFEVVEKDVLAMQHGQIILGGYYFKCFVTKSAKREYLTNKRYMKLTLTLHTDFPFWVKETTTSFGTTGTAAEGQPYLDYSVDYPMDFFCDMAIKPIVNNGFVASDFRLVIHGACVNPSVNIADHIYQVNCIVGENEHLTIDSSAKKIYLTSQDGIVTNQFNNRHRTSYVFEKIPTGRNVVLWNGDFGFDIILLEERSEPKWT